MLSPTHEFPVLVIRSEVLRHGSIDTYAVHCLRGQVFSRCKSELFVCTSHGLFHGCVIARCLFVLSRTSWQRVLRNRHRKRKMMTRSSSRFTCGTVGGGRMAALQCHDVLHIFSGTWLLLTEPPTQDQARRLPKDQFPHRVLVRVPTDVSVRSEEPSRAVSKPSVALAPPLC